MKPDEEIIGVATRVEYDESSGKIFVVFEITNPKHKQDIKKDWIKDIEFRLVDKLLVK